jgi:hypothetical protein
LCFTSFSREWSSNKSEVFAISSSNSCIPSPYGEVSPEVFLVFLGLVEVSGDAICNVWTFKFLCSPNMYSLFFVLRFGRKEFFVEQIVLKNINNEESLLNKLKLWVYWSGGSFSF